MLLTSQKIEDIEKELASKWQEFEDIKNFNQVKVLKAFQEAGAQNSHYTWVTGYGYDDLGKDKLDEIYALSFKAEAALVRPQLVSGTHAISSAVFGNLSAGQKLYCIGEPYDTLQTAFKKLAKKFSIEFNNSDDYLSIDEHQVKEANLVFIQRSRGYSWRESYTLEQLKNTIAKVKEINPKAIVFVDNCYGEFTQKQEPTEFGADIIAGSLIKNPGGGIVAAGAYIAGKKDCVEAAADFVTAPGIGMHGGTMFDQTRLMMQGFFMAPMIVFEALKGMSLAARLFQDYPTIPAWNSERNDIIQSIKFEDKDKLIEFCRLVQKNSPMNSMFSPIPDAISGYDDEIIMAAGSFIEGSSIELSADAPIRPPFIAYIQGGLSYAHTRYVLEQIYSNLEQ